MSYLNGDSRSSKTLKKREKRDAGVGFALTYG